MKRDNELIEKIENLLESSAFDGRDEEVSMINSLIRQYKAATYKEWDDRHEFYASKISSMVNDYGFRDDFIAEQICREHCTLQQNFTRFVMKFIIKEADNTFDPRNEASVKFCREVRDKVLSEENGTYYFPYI